MEEKTQLPKEDNNIPLTVEIVDLVIDMLSADASRARMEKEILKLLNRSAYATKLHQANETIKVLTYDNNRLKGQVEGLTNAVDELKRWKAEAMILLSKIDHYADKHPEIKLGMGKVEFTIERAKKYDESAAGREDAVDDWIDVNEKLPEEGGRYWCYVESLTDLGFSYFQWNCDYNDQLHRFSDMTLKNGERVTHWRPLAKPPIFKQQKEK